MTNNKGIFDNKNFIYYVTKPCHNENSKPSEPFVKVQSHFQNLMQK